MNPICLFKAFYRSIKHRAWVSGCDFREVDFCTPPNVQVLKCRVCGKVSVGWTNFWKDK